jgi:hypothetical protein
VVEAKISILTDKAWRELDSLTRKAYPRAVKMGMGKYLNLVRVESAKEVIPDRTGLPDFEDFRFRRMKYLDQLTHPSKLTSRSGRLLAGLLEGNDQHFDNLDQKTSKTNPSVFKSLQGKIVGGGQAGRSTSTVETFTGTWVPYVRSGSDMLQNMQMMGGPKRGISLSDAKKRASFRLKWETGIRGHKRMFMWPAHLKHQNSLNDFVETYLEREYVRKFNR